MTKIAILAAIAVAAIIGCANPNAEQEATPYLGQAMAEQWGYTDGDYQGTGWTIVKAGQIGYKIVSAISPSGQEAWSCSNGIPRVNVRFHREVALPVFNPYEGATVPSYVRTDVGESALWLDWQRWQSRPDTIRIKGDGATVLMESIRMANAKSVGLQINTDPELSRRIAVGNLGQHVGDHALDCFTP